MEWASRTPKAKTGPKYFTCWPSPLHVDGRGAQCSLPFQSETRKDEPHRGCISNDAMRTAGRARLGCRREAAEKPRAQKIPPQSRRIPRLTSLASHGRSPGSRVHEGYLNEEDIVPILRELGQALYNSYIRRFRTSLSTFDGCANSGRSR